MRLICSGQVNILNIKVSLLLQTLVKILRPKYNTAEYSQKKLFCGFNTHNQNRIRNVRDYAYHGDTFIASIIIYYNVLYIYYYIII